MKYLDLVNKTLIELNYKQVSSFSELIKNDHKKIKNILNVLNAEICNSTGWHFLLRKEELTLPAHTTEIDIPIEGKIASLIAGGQELRFTGEFEKFFSGSKPSGQYSVFSDKLLLPDFSQDVTLKILYYTSNYAVSDDEQEKPAMETGTDATLIPSPFAEPLLVYGTCMRLKGNPQHTRFGYWFNMYKEALANMRSKISINADETPSVRLHRQ